MLGRFFSLQTLVALSAFFVACQGSRAALSAALSPAESPFWPMPSDVVTLDQCSYEDFLPSDQPRLWIAPSFAFKAYGDKVLDPLVVRATKRYEELMHPLRVLPSDAFAVLSVCEIDILEELPSDTIIGSDESYQLRISISEEQPQCRITADTRWGALHGLETFSQLLVRPSPATAAATMAADAAAVFVLCAEVQLQDAPKYAHRGLLIDSARHFLPMGSLRRVIDALPFNKMNALHWHAVDAQSFPLHCPSEPRMSDAAFQPLLVYSQRDVRELVQYALDRGVELLLEIDVPGHAAAWTESHPELMAQCFEKYYYNINDFALNPALDGTYDTLRRIMSDTVDSMQQVSQQAPSALHLGGDEVVYGCWAEDESIIAFMQQSGFSSYDQLLTYFVKRADAILLDELNVSRVVHWNEVFSAGYGAVADRSRTVFQVWTDNVQVDEITASGFQVIASPHAFWYLDVAANSWQVMYGYDPAANLTDPSSQQPLVLGGEVALWGETIDEFNIEQTIFPRASAAAEVLWGKPAAEAKTTAVAMEDADDAVLQRLLSQRCRLVNRGVRAGPVQPGGYCDANFV